MRAPGNGAYREPVRGLPRAAAAAKPAAPAKPAAAQKPRRPAGGWAADPELWRVPLEGLPRHRTHDGYITVRVRSGCWEGEHRLVLARMLDRPLRPGETAHHRNGKRDDNRPENLELWLAGHRAGQRVSEAAVCCPNCGHALRLVG